MARQEEVGQDLRTGRELGDKRRRVIRRLGEKQDEPALLRKGTKHMVECT